MKKLIALLICFSFILTSVTYVFANGVQFNDVDKATSQGEAIYKLVEAGILSGYGDGTFRPANNLTRAELCKIINLAFGYTEASTDNFSDVSKDDWFYSYVAIAKKAGYIQGHGDGTFKGNDYLTREQACVVISRVAGLWDIPFDTQISDPVSDWAMPFVKKVLGNRIMNLEVNNTFRAKENITRGELVLSVTPFVKKAEDIKPSTGGSTGGGGGGSAGGGGGGSILPPPSGGNNGNTGTQPENPGTQPENPGTQPENPGTQPENPGTQPENPGTQPENPGTQPENPGTQPENPGTQPENPGTQPEQPGTEPEQPGTEPEQPEEPEVPVIDIEKQNQALININIIIDNIDTKSGRFPKYQQEVLTVIRAALIKTREDAEKNIAIYSGNYVLETYRNEINEAKQMYLDLTDVQKGNFERNLMTYFSTYVADELCYMIFGKKVDDLVDSM